VFEFGLAGYRIDYGTDESADTRIRGVRRVPVNGGERGAARDLTAGPDTRNYRAPAGLHTCELIRANTSKQRIMRMQVHKGLGQVLRETRSAAGARHGVPLIADAAGIEHEWKFVRRSATKGRNLRRDKARLMIGRKESTAGEKPRISCALSLATWPEHGCQTIE